MPKLMEKDDLMQTAVNLGRADKVWSDQVATASGVVSFRLPEGGMYQVVFLKVEPPPKTEAPKQKSAVDMIGYGRRFHKLRTTEEWMKELREGEED